MSKYGSLKRGDVGQDGRIFWSYNNGGNEWWMSVSDFVNRKENERHRQREWLKSESGAASFKRSCDKYRSSEKFIKTQKEFRKKYQERPYVKSAACAKEGRRRAAKANSQHSSSFEIKFLYELCRAISRVGEPHHVDHVTPLSRGGKHVIENLKIVPARANLSKGAKLLA